MNKVYTLAETFHRRKGICENMRRGSGPQLVFKLGWFIARVRAREVRREAVVVAEGLEGQGTSTCANVGDVVDFLSWQDGTKLVSRWEVREES